MCSSAYERSVAATGKAAPVGASAPSGGKQDEVAAAVAEAKAEGEKQRDDGDFDDVKGELEAAAAEPKVHLSAAKEKRLAERKQHETVSLVSFMPVYFGKIPSCRVAPRRNAWRCACRTLSQVVFGDAITCVKSLVEHEQQQMVC